MQLATSPPSTRSWIAFSSNSWAAPYNNTQGVPLLSSSEAKSHRCSTPITYRGVHSAPRPLSYDNPRPKVALGSAKFILGSARRRSRTQWPGSVPSNRRTRPKHTALPQ